MNPFARAYLRVAIPARLAVKAFSTPVAFGAAALVEAEAGRVIVVRHSYMPGWHLPGGGVEAGEPPAQAVLRELKEEIGLQTSAPPALVALFTRKVGIATNLVALYRVREAKLAFKPNWEVRAIQAVDPAAPPPGTSLSTRQRLAECCGQAPLSPYW